MVTGACPTPAAAGRGSARSVDKPPSARSSLGAGRALGTGGTLGTGGALGTGRGLGVPASAIPAYAGNSHAIAARLLSTYLARPVWRPYARSSRTPQRA